MARLVDLAAKLPTELLQSIGDLTVLFGRLEHMVLLALKRKRGISIGVAMDEYKSHSLGARLFGKLPCKNAEEDCRNYGSAAGLRSFSDKMPGLRTLCERIQKLTEERNKFMHGLITTVGDEAILVHDRKIFRLKANELSLLRSEVVEIIGKLNSMIPVPGVSATVVTGHDLDVSYEASRFSARDNKHMIAISKLTKLSSNYPSHVSSSAAASRKY